MRKVAILAMSLGIFASTISVSYSEFKKFNVYSDDGAADNHYTPSGWMGNRLEYIDTACKDNPHSGTTCIKVDQYVGVPGSWTGLFWLNPADNWGTLLGGYDLTDAKKLVFWARGEKGGEVITEFKMGGIVGPYSDTATAGIKNVTLTPEWKEYTIDLTGKDLSRICGGFCWIISFARNPLPIRTKITFYVDDIYYE